MKKTVVLLAVMLIVFCGSVAAVRHLSMNVLDNDTSGEMLLSHCIYEEKSPICSDWNYSTEYRITNQVVFALLFAVFDAWIDVRIIGILVIEIILVLSFIFMMYGAGLKTDSVLFGAILIMLPYCVAYGRIVLFYGFYAPYLIFMFLDFGCFFRCLNNGQKHRSLWAAALFIFSLLGCVSGVRQFFITMVPMAALALLFWIRTKKSKPLIITLLSLSGGAAGLLIYRLVIMKAVSLHAETLTKIVFKGVSEVFIVIFTVLRQFGYRSGINKFSFLGMMSFGGILVTGYVLLCSFTALIKENDEKAFYLKGMVFAAVTINCFLFLFAELPYNEAYDYSRYLTPASVWCVPLFCVLFERKQQMILRVLYGFILVIFVGNGVINLCFLENPSHFSQEFDGLSFRETADIGIYGKELDFIRAGGYELGYAFSDPNVISEKLNGLPVVPIEVRNDDIVYFDWLTRKSFRDTPADKAFLCARPNEAGTFLAYPISDYANYAFTDNGEWIVFEITDLDAFKKSLAE